MNGQTFGVDQPVGDDGEHRRQPRVTLTVAARMRDRLSNKYEVRLQDLSVTGFRAEAHYSLDPGAIVWLTIPGLQALEAIVAWRDGRTVGCQFRQPLYPAVLDHIVRTLG